MAKILIVEDEYVIAMGIQSKLRGWGYEVTGVATSAEEAVAKTESDRPDLVLMDIRLQGETDGISAATKVSERFRVPHIYVTAYGNDRTVQRAKLTGPCGFIVKPFSDQTLHSAVEVGLHANEINQVRELLVERLEAFSGRLALTEQSERQRLAYELHEGVANNLAALCIRLNIFKLPYRSGKEQENLAKAMQIAEQTLKHVRAMAEELYPLGLDILGLSSLLRRYASLRAEAAGWKMHIDIPEENKRLSAPLEIACFYLLQEALDNVQRHAKANEVWVELHMSADELVLTIRDNGIGFDLSPRQGNGKREIGVFEMQQRAKYAGGQLDTKFIPGAGTEIRAFFPLVAPAA